MFLSVSCYMWIEWIDFFPLFGYGFPYMVSYRILFSCALNTFCWFSPMLRPLICLFGFLIGLRDSFSFSCWWLFVIFSIECSPKGYIWLLASLTHNWPFCFVITSIFLLRSFFGSFFMSKFLFSLVVFSFRPLLVISCGNIVLGDLILLKCTCSPFSFNPVFRIIFSAMTLYFVWINWILNKSDWWFPLSLSLFILLTNLLDLNPILKRLFSHNNIFDSVLGRAAMF